MARTRIGNFGLVNYREHPTQKNYTVFNFMTESEANLFEEILIREKLWYEKDEDEVKAGKTYLFGVKKDDFERVQRANFEVAAKHRKPLITNKILRYSLLIIFFGFLAIAIIGYIKS